MNKSILIVIKLHKSLLTKEYEVKKKIREKTNVLKIIVGQSSKLKD